MFAIKTNHSPKTLPGMCVDYYSKSSKKLLKRRKVQSTRSSPDSPDMSGNFQNVRRRAAVKFNQMSGEKLQMSGEAKKDFAYTESGIYIQLSYTLKKFTLLTGILQTHGAHLSACLWRAVTSMCNSCWGCWPPTHSFMLMAKPFLPHTPSPRYLKM